MNKIAFPRIARQLNYRRTLTSPVTARVDIPGFPYEAFDQSGAKVQPWSLLRFFESVRACTFWDYKTAESLADFHIILKDHLFFIVGAKLTIRKEFYSEDSPKFPLFVIASLDQVGRSSKRLSYRLFHEDAKEEYAALTVDDVLVSNQSRKPVAYPDWWMEKFAHMCKEKTTSSNSEIPHLELSESKVTTFEVNLTDIDTYKHTNWSAYIKFCFESVYKHVFDKKYKTINQDCVESGVESMYMVYKNESKLYDTLSVLTQEDRALFNRVYGNVVKNDGTLCFQVVMDFYNDTDQSKI